MRLSTHPFVVLSNFHPGRYGRRDRGLGFLDAKPGHVNLRNFGVTPSGGQRVSMTYPAGAFSDNDHNELGSLGQALDSEYLFLCHIFDSLGKCKEFLIFIFMDEKERVLMLLGIGLDQLEQRVLDQHRRRRQ